MAGTFRHGRVLDYRTRGYELGEDLGSGTWRQEEEGKSNRNRCYHPTSHCCYLLGTGDIVRAINVFQYLRSKVQGRIRIEKSTSGF